jgi:hypothetical protein
MTDTEIKAGLLSLAPSHPFVRAVEALLTQAVEAETDSVTAPDLTDAARHFNAGRLAHAQDFKLAITGAIAEAQREAQAKLAAAAKAAQD